MAFCPIFEYGVLNDIHYYYGQFCNDCSYADSQSPDSLPLTTGCTECGNDCGTTPNDIETFSSHKHGCSKKLKDDGITSYVAPKDDPADKKSKFQPKFSNVKVVSGSDSVVQVKKGGANKFKARVMRVQAEFTFDGKTMKIGHVFYKSKIQMFKILF